MTGERLAYPKVPGDLVGSINAVSRTGLRIPADGEPGFSVSPAPNVAYQTCLTLGVTVGGSRARLHLDAAAVDAVVGGFIAADAFTALDSELQLAVLETAMASPLARLGETLRSEVVVQAIRTAPAEADSGGTPDSDSSGGQRPSAGSLLLEVHGIRDTVYCTVLLDIDAPLPDAVTTALGVGRRRWDCSHLPVRVTFEAGCASVAAREFMMLEPGDIVLFDQCYVADDRVRVNICDTEFRVGRLEGLCITLEAGAGRDGRP